MGAQVGSPALQLSITPSDPPPFPRSLMKIQSRMRQALDDVTVMSWGEAKSG